MTPLRVAVAEDEPPARARLVRQLVECGCEVVAELADGPALLAWLRGAPRVDALFLDIRMPGATGFDVLARLEQDTPVPRLVFVTAHAEHSLRAFDVEAVDYLVKPVSIGRLERAVERLRRRGGQRPAVNPETDPAGAPRTRFPVRRGEAYAILDLARVTHFQMDDEIVWAWVSGRRYRTPWRRLSEVEATFPGAPFLRIQRHLLLRPEMIVAAAPLLGGRLRVNVGHDVELTVSRSATPSLRARLGL